MSAVRDNGPTGLAESYTILISFPESSAIFLAIVPMLIGSPEPILVMVGVMQIVVMVFAFGTALSRASVLNNWEEWDVFYFKRFEKFFVRMLTNKKYDK